VHTSAQNIGSSALPFGTGNHPYFTVGSSTINLDYLRIPAQSYLSTDDQLIPVMPPVRVADTPYDFREMRAIGDAIIDLCFTDLIRDDDGFARVLLSSADRKRTLSIYVDAFYQYLQIFTGDTIPDPSRRRGGLAVESCTCAPNAFNNSQGLVILAPGQSFSCAWGVSTEQ
jgi:aldose 1-epimerase